MNRLSWINRESDISVVRQCELVGVTRSVVYNAIPAVRVSEEDLLLCRLIDEEYTRHPFYGSRRMVHVLRAQGQTSTASGCRLMRHMGLAGMAPGPNTSTVSTPTCCEGLR